MQICRTISRDLFNLWIVAQSFIVLKNLLQIKKLITNQKILS